MQDVSGCSFQELLKLLSEAHEHEISLLKKTIASHRAETILGVAKDGRRTTVMEGGRKTVAGREIPLVKRKSEGGTKKVKRQASSKLRRSDSDVLLGKDNSTKTVLGAMPEAAQSRATNGRATLSEDRDNPIAWQPVESTGSKGGTQSKRGTAQKDALTSLQEYLKDGAGRKTEAFGARASMDSVSSALGGKTPTSGGAPRRTPSAQGLSPSAQGSSLQALPQRRQTEHQAPPLVSNASDLANGMGKESDGDSSDQSSTPSNFGMGKSFTEPARRSQQPSPTHAVQKYSTLPADLNEADMVKINTVTSEHEPPPLQTIDAEQVEGPANEIDKPQHSDDPGDGPPSTIHSSKDVPSLPDVHTINDFGMSMDMDMTRTGTSTSQKEMDDLRAKLHQSSLKKQARPVSAPPVRVTLQDCPVEEQISPQTSPSGREHLPPPLLFVSGTAQMTGTSSIRSSNASGPQGPPVDAKDAKSRMKNARRSLSADALLLAMKSADAAHLWHRSTADTKESKGGKRHMSTSFVEAEPRASVDSLQSLAEYCPNRNSGIQYAEARMSTGILKPARHSNVLESADYDKEKSPFTVQRKASNVSFCPEAVDPDAELESEDEFPYGDGRGTAEGCQCFWLNEALELDIEENNISVHTDRASAARQSMFDPLDQARNSRRYQSGYQGDDSNRPQSYIRRSVFSSTSNDSDQKCLLSLDSFVGHPNSILNFQFDCTSLLLIAYDFVIIPAQVFTTNSNAASRFMAVFKILFWTADLFRSFFVGYYSLGDVVLIGRAVILKYVKTYFVPNMILVLLDWNFLVMELADFWDRDPWRWVPALRVLCLFRVCKAFYLIKMIEDRITSELLSVLWRTCKFFLFLLLLNHLAACAWYWIGNSFKDTHDTWVSKYLENDTGSGGRLFTSLGDKINLGYRYTTSFHWALTQFTPASIAVQPHNVYERVFAIIVLLFALVTTSTFVSGITGAVMQMASLKSAKSKQFWLLRRYLKESHVPTPLSARIHNFCDYAWDRQQAKVQERNVQMLGLLSQQLSAELKTAIYEPIIAVHPFFVLISKLAPLTVQALCNTATAGLSLGRGDHLFSRGEAAAHMYCISDGELVYDVIHQDPVDVKRRTWLCEPVLWTNWFFIGNLRATTECHLVSISDERFAIAIRSNLDIQYEVANYAKGFVAGLNKVPIQKLSDLYKSQMLEGLWFRLLHEHNLRNAGIKMARQASGLERIGRTASIRCAWCIPSCCSRHKVEKLKRSSSESVLDDPEFHQVG